MLGFFFLLIITLTVMISYSSYHLKTLFKTRWILVIPAIIALLLISVRFLGIHDIYWLSFLSAYAFALLICLVFSGCIVDITKLITRYAFHASLSNTFKQVIFSLATIGLFSGGIYLATVPQISHYSVTVQKNTPIDKLRIVHLSDLHINNITSKTFIEKMVKKVNAQNPDLIVITGDILDNRLQPFLDNQLNAFFVQLKSTYGTVVVLGNHEYYGIARIESNTIDDVITAFTKSNMKVLQDSIITLPGTSITLIGRDDYASERLDRKRTPLKELIANIDTATSVMILLDHQPRDLDEAAENGIDIMFSGHTHAGQIFPGTLIVKYLYQNAWGLLQKENAAGKRFTSIVTSGYGLWGPPIRLMSRAEIVVTDINFKPTSFTH